MTHLTWSRTACHRAEYHCSGNGHNQTLAQCGHSSLACGRSLSAPCPLCSKCPTSTHQSEGWNPGGWFHLTRNDIKIKTKPAWQLWNLPTEAWLKPATQKKDNKCSRLCVYYIGCIISCCLLTTIKLCKGKGATLCIVYFTEGADHEMNVSVITYNLGLLYICAVNICLWLTHNWADTLSSQLVLTSGHGSTFFFESLPLGVHTPVCSTSPSLSPSLHAMLLWLSRSQWVSCISMLPSGMWLFKCKCADGTYTDRHSTMCF